MLQANFRKIKVSEEIHSMLKKLPRLNKRVSKVPIRGPVLDSHINHAKNTDSSLLKMDQFILRESW